ncbi:MAG: PhoH family protein, partial [Gammaproteobacteria bacterium]|nr:PhoH family protein [Gammaproteobacteria bacterium]
MNQQTQSLDIALEPADNERLANLCGAFDAHLRQLERRLGIEINSRGNVFRVIGESKTVRIAGELLKELYALTAEQTLNPEQIHLSLQESGIEDLLSDQAQKDDAGEIIIKTKRGQIRGRGPAQKQYLKNIQNQDLCFGIGPAGTGKTYLA